MDRTTRQQVSIQKILGSNCKGTIEAATGFGKTRIATETIKLLRRNNASRSVIIVVPTIPLKKQWEEGLAALSLARNTEVYVINTLIKKQITCSLLVLDEIHRYAAATFAKVFTKVQYTFILGLTATLKRLDGKHVLLQQKAPILDSISMRECKRNGWLSPFKEYNLYLEMDDESKQEYLDMTVKFGRYFSTFQSDFEAMKNCSYSINPSRKYVNGIWMTFDPPVVKYARQLGWRGNSAVRAYELMERNKNTSRGQKVDIWGNGDAPQSPQKLYVFAVQGMRLMREMKNFIYNHPLKTEVAEKILKQYPDKKALTFGETTDSADILANAMGRYGLAYHSNIESAVERVRKTKNYKTEKSADSWIAKHPEWNKTALVDGTYNVFTYIEKKVSGKAIKERALEKLMGTGAVRVVCTARALDQGFDFPGCSLGIIYARTSSSTQQVQRTGRIVRKHFFDDGSEKEGIVINLVLKDTKDEKWLSKAQKESADYISIYSLKELFDDIEGKKEGMVSFLALND